MPTKKTLFLHCLLLLSIFTSGGCHATRPTTTSGFLTVENDRLYYEVSGDGFPLVWNW